MGIASGFLLGLVALVGGMPREIVSGWIDLVADAGGDGPEDKLGRHAERIAESAFDHVEGELIASGDQYPIGFEVAHGDGAREVSPDAVVPDALAEPMADLLADIDHARCELVADSCANLRLVDLGIEIRRGIGDRAARVDGVIGKVADGVICSRLGSPRPAQGVHAMGFGPGLDSGVQVGLRLEPGVRVHARVHAQWCVVCVVWWILHADASCRP